MSQPSPVQSYLEDKQEFQEFLTSMFRERKQDGNDDEDTN